MPKNDTWQAAYQRMHITPGTYGRWCPDCATFKECAAIERTGATAHNAVYRARCCTCGAYLLSIPPPAITHTQAVTRFCS
jgi:hypothetical protein